MLIHGRHLCAAKHYREAVDEYTAATEADPTNPIYLSNRSFAHLRLEEFGAALVDASKAIELDPTYVKVRVFGCGGEGVVVMEGEHSVVSPTDGPSSCARPTTDAAMRPLRSRGSRTPSATSGRRRAWRPATRTSAKR